MHVQWAPECTCLFVLGCVEQKAWERATKTALAIKAVDAEIQFGQFENTVPNRNPHIMVGCLLVGLITPSLLGNVGCTKGGALQSQKAPNAWEQQLGLGKWPRLRACEIRFG